MSSTEDVPISAEDAKDKEAEIKELLKKMQDSSNGPEHADRRIRELDKMVKRLKQNRRNCQAEIDKDNETLKWIQREREAIKSRYSPLCARLKEREDTAQQIRDQIQMITKQFGSILQNTRKHITKATIAESKHRKNAATSVLRSQRGFSGAKEDKPHLKGTARLILGQY
eukprot:TRINITY_DN777839_c0_g1_i1.p1 TRINITY_DN777839_c0_g1~~TRINITY_DN777839_c0_g1_i1.p1  ORF type:complete len:170 (-),score=33.31 TRINITY_DN777839_c0_g1_i1:120-629(-)